MRTEKGIETEFRRRAGELIEAGRTLHGWGMLPVASGNLSARLSNGELAITVSGSHKGRLKQIDIMRVDADGRPLDGRRPSAETLLHVQAYKYSPGVGAVLHTHSVSATLLSRLDWRHFLLDDYELLKAFPGIDTHDALVKIPRFANDQDVARLASIVACYREANPPIHGYLVQGHGFYTWGESIDDALRHVEAFEFLFDCELRALEIKGRT